PAEPSDAGMFATPESPLSDAKRSSCTATPSRVAWSKPGLAYVGESVLPNFSHVKVFKKNLGPIRRLVDVHSRSVLVIGVCPDCRWVRPLPEHADCWVGLDNDP